MNGMVSIRRLLIGGGALGLCTALLAVAKPAAPLGASPTRTMAQQVLSDSANVKSQ